MNSSQTNKREGETGNRSEKEIDSTILSKTYMTREELEPLKYPPDKEF